MLSLFLKTYLIVAATLVAEKTVQLYKGYKKNKERNPFILRCGDVTFNFKMAAHLLVCGLSGQGKTYFTETLLKGREDISVILLNAFREDFKSLKCKRYNNTTDIVTLLSEVSEGKLRGTEDKPLYIVIDELLELTLREKTIGKLLQRAITTARHYYVYFIVIVQEALKEVLTCKSLFNQRVCFKMLEQSSYNVALGFYPEETLTRIGDYFHRTHDKIGVAHCPKV